MNRWKVLFTTIAGFLERLHGLHLRPNRAYLYFLSKLVLAWNLLREHAFLKVLGKLAHLLGVEVCESLRGLGVGGQRLVVKVGQQRTVLALQFARPFFLSFSSCGLLGAVAL